MKAKEIEVGHLIKSVNGSFYGLICADMGERFVFFFDDNNLLSVEISNDEYEDLGLFKIKFKEEIKIVKSTVLDFEISLS